MENFKGAMLSFWNSVSGPKIEHLWLLNDHALFYLPPENYHSIKYFDIIKDRFSFIPILKICENHVEKTEEGVNFPSLIENIQYSIKDFKKYLRMSGKLLLTEMETKRPFTENYSRVYQLENKILFSVVFHKKNDGEDDLKNFEKLCLSLMFSTKHCNFIFKIQNILDLYMRQIVCTIQKSTLDEILKSEDILMHYKSLCEAIELVYSEAKSSDECYPRFSQFKLRVKFLSRAIVSHLQTSGSSVVIGSSKFTVNQVALVLLLFTTDKEKYFSVPLIKKSQGTCYRGLKVQALLKDYNDYQRLELPEECYNDTPITIIDTDSYKVRQSLNFKFHPNDSKSMNTVTDSGKLIPKFLEDMFLYEAYKLPAKDLLNSLCKCIDIKAVTLIKLVERFRHDNCIPIEKEIMTLMDITDIADFKIYLGFAEKLKPQIRTFIM